LLSEPKIFELVSRVVMGGFHLWCQAMRKQIVFDCEVSWNVCAGGLGAHSAPLRNLGGALGSN
jgi:hypothetical protein